MNKLRLGVNIDHVATIRNARGGRHPDPIRAAFLAVQAGADSITAHLREDRRHISDSDIDALADRLTVPLNLEMAATSEMLDIALRHKPHACCLVPEKREEVTTEGGLDVAGQHNHLVPFVRQLNEAGIRVSMFIDPDRTQMDATASIGAPVAEIHVGPYCDSEGVEQQRFLTRIADAARYGHSLGIEMHAGHGFSYENVAAVAELPEFHELNIGHFLVGEAVFVGFEEAIKRMRHLMDEARLQGYSE